jgi:hypothetical protein
MAKGRLFGCPKGASLLACVRQLPAAVMTGLVLSGAIVHSYAAQGMDNPKLSSSGIANQHPAQYYRLAARLFANGQKDEAVFWFYVGQLRFRFHLMAHPDLPRDKDGALFSSLSEVVGRPINEYAFGHLPSLLETLDKVLAWDASTTNGFTSKQVYARELSKIRQGLAELRQQIQAQASEIRQKRSKNGLDNRSP